MSFFCNAPFFESGKYIFAKFFFCVLIIVLSLSDSVHAQRDIESMIIRAERLIEEDKLEEALEAYLEVLELLPENFEVRFKVGLLYGWNSRFEEAELTLKQLHEEFPEDGDVTLALVRVLSWQEKFSEARALGRNLVAQNPENAEAHALLSQVNLWNGNVNLSHRRVKKALEIDKEQPLARSILLTLHESMAPSLETFLNLPWDIDRTHLVIYGQRFEMGVIPALRVHVNWASFHTENRRTGQQADARVLGAGVTWQNSRPWVFRGNIGTTLFPDNTLNTGAVFNGALSAQYNYRYSIHSLTLSRFALTESPAMVFNRITVNGLGYSWYRKWDQHMFTISPELAYFSDENFRFSLQGLYKYTIETGDWQLQPGAKIRYMGFEQSRLGQGYYAPERMFTGALTADINWVPENRKWSALLHAEIGMQTVKNFGVNATDPSLSYNLNPVITYTHNKHWYFEAGYLYSNMLTMSTESSATDFWYQMFHFKVRINFSKKVNPFTASCERSLFGRSLVR